MARRGVAFACVDNGPSALSPAEERTHIALWAILKSPLLLSCDVRSLSEETLGLLLNKDMLQIFDDPAARQVADDSSLNMQCLHAAIRSICPDKLGSSACFYRG
jgi:hypothetical protein